MEKTETKRKRRWVRCIWALYLVSCMIIFSMVIRDMGQLYGRYNENQMEVMAGLLAEKVNISIGHIVDNAEQAALIMGANYDNNANTLYEEMQGYVQSTSFISMGVVDQTGKFYGKTGEWRDMNKYNYISKALRTDGIYITEPYRSSVTATHLITVLAPIYVQDGRKAIMYASFPLEIIQEFARTDALEYQPEIALLNAASGNYIACTSGAIAAAGNWNNLMLMREQMQFENETAYTDYIQSLQIREDSGIVRFSLNNEDYIQGYVQIESMPDWYIVVNISSKSLSDLLVRYQTRIMGYAGIFVGITVVLLIWQIVRQLMQKKKLQRLSEIDPLTGIMNKRAFIAGFHDFVEKAQKNAEGILIFVDVDDFKMYNDTYGHLAGDEVLKQVATTLSELFGENGLIGRYGGDEFVMFLKGKRSKEDVEKRMLQAKETFHNMEIPDIGKVSVGLSVGLACFPVDGDTYEELCDSADKAVYCVKERGKDGFAWYRENTKGEIV